MDVYQNKICLIQDNELCISAPTGVVDVDFPAKLIEVGKIYELDIYMTLNFHLTTHTEICSGVVEAETHGTGTRGSCPGAPTSVQLTPPHLGIASKMSLPDVNETADYTVHAQTPLATMKVQHPGVITRASSTVNDMKESLLFPADAVHNCVPKSMRDHVCGCCASPDGIARAKNVKIKG
eukprot:12156254-Heterocapsa_arctica.AAC.1